MIITSVSPSRWQAAQRFERRAACILLHRGDDWNDWWFEKFDGYNAIRDRDFPNVLEVGCGPNTNVRLILPLIRCNSLHLEDPLIRFCLRHGIVASLVAETHPEPLEELALSDASIDLLICINVLDHVQDAVKCFQQMRRVLKPGGVLILGQDLSNKEDYELCPESWDDIGHPIKLDEETVNAQLNGFTPLYKKVLPREEGRNPKCHYGTLALITRKDQDV